MDRPAAPSGPPMGRAMRAGMRGVVQSGPGLYVDSDTGHVVIPYGNGTYLDTVIGFVVDENGNIVKTAAEMKAGGSTPPASSSPLHPDSGGSGAQVAEDVKDGIKFAAALTGALLGPHGVTQPTPQPKGLSTGEKVAIGVGFVGIAAGAAWAGGLFGGKRRSRRRRG